MIGMNQIKQRTYTGIAIGLGIGLVIVGLTVWWTISTIKSYEDGTNASYNLKYTTNVAVLNRNIVQGQIVTDDMVTTQRIHNTTKPAEVLTASEVVGKVAKYNIVANAPITKNMLTDQIEEVDVRMQEVNTVLMPSDLAQDEYIDIRIMYPNGTDYIVLSSKRVEKIQEQTMWVRLSEDERLILNGATVDSFLNRGTKLYATKYVDKESQVKSTNDENGDGVIDINDDAVNIAKGYLKEQIVKEMDSWKNADDDQLTTSVLDFIYKYRNLATSVRRTSENYQPNSQIIDMMKTDSNILPTAQSKLSKDARTLIENALAQYESQNTDKYNMVISGAQQSISTQQSLRTALLSGAAAQTTQTGQ